MPKPKGAKVSYESHTIPYVIPGIYHPDFRVLLPDGKEYFVEVKGYFRPEDKRKMAAVIRCNPDKDIRMVFPRYSYANKKWCEKMGIKYAFGSVPKEWFHE